MSGLGEDGAEPDVEIERLRAALYAPDASAEAAERYRAALARAMPDADAGPAPQTSGTATAERSPTVTTEAPPAAAPRSRQRIRTALVAGGLLLAAGIGAALLVPHPAPEFSAPPLKLGPALWSANGVHGASSLDLDGGHRPLLVQLSCRGEGRILLAVDSRVRNLTCAKGRSIEDDQYFDGAHDTFLLSVSVIGRPTWSASVHRVLSGSAG